jgi:hypothetical protein
MLKAWSITTTVRNPERIRSFLVAIMPLENKVWNNVAQEKYQKILIQNRLYGYGKQQFYNGLPADIVNLIKNADSEISEAVIDEIKRIKNYRDFAMRGRNSINPLTKFGFVYIDDGIVKITDLGKKLIATRNDFGNVFLKSFIKWQIPNPASKYFTNKSDYNIVPFVATLKLIDEVNKLENARGNNAKGLSKREFSLFVPTLVKYTDISHYAREIISLRDQQTGKSQEERKRIRNNYRNSFVSLFIGTNDKDKVQKFLATLRDYGDNAIRYFRLTKFIRIRGGGFYVDLEPNRHTEIESLLEKEFYKPNTFTDRIAYLRYMADDALPKLPWQTKEKLEIIANEIIVENKQLEQRINSPETNFRNIADLNETELMTYITELREQRKTLREKENRIKSQPVESIAEYIESLENISKFENRALMLEYFSTMGLHALNDAKEIRPNYPVGDDNMPTSTAPGGVSDIECFYNDFNMICEVTMLKSRNQWFNEGQPVMRHLRDFESKNENSYCVFIAPIIHTDSAETFYLANIFGYKGAKQKIAPLTIKQFVKILKALKTLREAHRQFTHAKLGQLISSIVSCAATTENSDVWITKIPALINNWISGL